MTSEFDRRFAIYLNVFYFITKIYCFAFECEAFLCIVSLLLNLILHKLQYPFCMQSLLKEKIPKEYVYCFSSDIANSNYYICSQEIKHFLQYSRPPENNVLQNPYLPGYAWLELHARIPAINILNFTERASFYSITYVNV